MLCDRFQLSTLHFSSFQTTLCYYQLYLPEYMHRRSVFSGVLHLYAISNFKPALFTAIHYMQYNTMQCNNKIQYRIDVGIFLVFLH